MSRDVRPVVPSGPVLTVFAAGVASMGFEILAGRLVAPAFGSSVYTWGGVIAVFLTALSAGYAVGGRYASRYASADALAVVLGGAALLVAALTVAVQPVLSVVDALAVPDRYAVVVPATLLFGPLTFLLGLISPFAAELSAADSHGWASGRVYAVGTVGSIVGAFGTTFLLIPWLPVDVISMLLGSLLLVAAVLVAAPSPRSVATVGTAVVALLAVAVVSTYGASAGPEVVHAEQTPYSHLRIVDEDGVRTMYLDGSPQSATYLDDREGYVFGYSQYAHLPVLMQRDVDRVLVIGGGGFSTPKRYLREYPNVTVDVVEIDPDVVSAAKRYFGVEEGPRLNVYVMDGRTFLERTNRTYDVIVLDAFRKSRVPFHLTTREFDRLVRSRLDDDGVLLANVISARSGEGSAFYRAMVKTLNATYPDVYVFPTADTTALQNIELVATKRPTDFDRADLLARNDPARVGLDLSGEIRRLRHASDVPTDDVPILTDEYAPVDRLVNEQVGKRYVVVRNRTTTQNETGASGTEPTVASPDSAAVP